MSRFGTGLSRFLYVAMIVGLGLMLLALIAGILVGVVALVDPTAFETLRTSVNGQPVHLRQPQLALSIAALIMLAASFGAAVLWQLMGMLKSAADGEPFTPANVRRLRILAAIFATLTAVQLSAFLLPASVRDGLNMREANLDVGTLFAALLALVLAEVFRAGVALREDAEGTI